MILENYICLTPFRNIEIHEEASYLCCPSWLNESSKNVSIPNQWNSDVFKNLRKTMFDSSFKYCSKINCPFLSGLLSGNNKARLGTIVKKEEFYNHIKNYNEVTGEMTCGPEVVQYSFDNTCNYMCTSCRLNIQVADSNKIKEVQATIDEIENTYSKDIRVIYMSGTADPFVSVSFRKFLREFNPEKYPKLEKIHLHTNASMWNEEMWGSMKNVHKYIKSCEISIDAATKDTYENYTRIGGKWNILIDNLKFISTIPTLNFIRTSFVVQACNYQEMQEFQSLMKKIFNQKAIIYFGKILNWGTFNDGEYLLRKIWDINHPEYSEFINALKKIASDRQTVHNMHEILSNKSII